MRHAAIDLGLRHTWFSRKHRWKHRWSNTVRRSLHLIPGVIWPSHAAEIDAFSPVEPHPYIFYKDAPMLWQNTDCSNCVQVVLTSHDIVYSIICTGLSTHFPMAVDFHVDFMILFFLYLKLFCFILLNSVIEHFKYCHISVLTHCPDSLSWLQT